MDAPRILAGGLAASHLWFGVNLLARPRSARSSWIGRVARKPGAQVMIRSQGARDVALGAGTLWALATRPDADARAWVAANAFADAADAAATWLALDKLPKRRGRAALAMAAGSTAIALASTAGLSRTRRTPAP